MKIKCSMAIALLASLLFASGAHALSYQGTLTTVAPVTGTVGGFGWVDDEGSEVDFWQFTAVAGNVLNISATRLVEALDPAFTLYFGTSTASDSAFVHNASFGGLTFLAIANDEIANPGPFGDPLLSLFRVPFTGSYTLAVGGDGSENFGPYGYSLRLQAVPVPATLLLALTGLLCLGYRRRSR